MPARRRRRRSITYSEQHAIRANWHIHVIVLCVWYKCHVSFLVSDTCIKPCRCNVHQYSGYLLFVAVVGDSRSCGRISRAKAERGALTQHQQQKHYVLSVRGIVRVRAHARVPVYQYNPSHSYSGQFVEHTSFVALGDIFTFLCFVGSCFGGGPKILHTRVHGLCACTPPCTAAGTATLCGPHVL